MFAIEVSATFSAAHALRLPNAAQEPLHGHDFQLTVRVTSRALDSLYTVMDFHVLERLIREIIAPWSNRNLNEIEPFDSAINPSAEGISQEIGARLEQRLLAAFPQGIRARGLRLAEVRITEAPNCLAIWTPDSA